MGWGTEMGWRWNGYGDEGEMGYGGEDGGMGYSGGGWGTGGGGEMGYGWLRWDGVHVVEVGVGDGVWLGWDGVRFIWPGFIALHSTYRAKWIRVNGQQYKPSCAVVIGIGDEYPQFGEVEHIFIVDGRALLQVETYSTRGFSSHYHVYHIENTSCHKFIAVSDLILPFPSIVRHVNSMKCIVLKFHICGTMFDC